MAMPERMPETKNLLFLMEIMDFYPKAGKIMEDQSKICQSNVKRFNNLVWSHEGIALDFFFAIVTQ